MIKTILSFFLLPMLVFINLKTTYEDIRFGKIRNKWIILGICWGLIIFSLFFVLFLISEFFSFLQNSPIEFLGLSPLFLIKTILNFLVAVAVAFLMWKFNVWAAGDSKLFLLNSLLLPLFFYDKAYFYIFPSFVLLVNIFSIFLIFLFLNASYFFIKSFLGFFKAKPSLFALKREIKRLVFNKIHSGEVIKNFWVSPIRIILMPLTIILFFTFLQDPLDKYFKIDAFSLQSFLFAGLIIFYKKVSDLFRKKIFFICLLAIFMLTLTLGFYLQGAVFLPVLYLAAKTTIIFMVILLLFRRLIDGYLEKTQTKKIKANELLPETLVAASSLERLQLNSKEYSKIRGLDQNQIDEIKKRAIAQNLQEIEIYRASNFALWIFMGTLITIFFNQPIFNLIFRTYF